MTTPLTGRRLNAIREALQARLAGEIDVESEVDRKDYEAAFRWATERSDRIAARKDKK